MGRLHSTSEGSFLRHGCGAGGQEYTGFMAIVEAAERHQDLIDELLADLSSYLVQPDKELVTRASSAIATISLR